MSRRKRNAARPAKAAPLLRVDGSPEPASRRALAGLLPAAAVFLVALAVRTALVFSLRNEPLILSPQLDALENLGWATRVAAGDFRIAPFPTHAPGYPFFLGLLLHLFAGSATAARLAQAVLGAVTASIAAVTARRLWGPVAGAAAGGLLAFQGPLAFTETMLWEEALLLFLSAFAALLLVTSRRTPGVAAMAGALLGAAVVTRPTALLLVAAAALSIFVLDPWPRRTASGLAFLLASALFVIPATAVVSRASGTFLFLRGYGSINLWIGNDPAGGGVQNARLGGAWDSLEGEPFREGLGPAEAEGYFLGKTFRRALANPLGLGRVLLSKMVWLTQTEEPRDNHSFYFFEGRSRLLAFLPGFGLLIALAATGVAAGGVRKDTPVMLWALLASAILPALLALVGLRYRMPVVPLLALFSGRGAAALFDSIRAKEIRRTAGLAAVAAVVFGVSLLRTSPASRNVAEELALGGNSLLQLNRPSEAEASYRQATEADPGLPLGWEGLGRVELRAGRIREAEALFRKSVAIDPLFRKGHYHLGLAAEILGDSGEAERSYRRALAISPRYFEALSRLGALLARQGRTEEAAEVLERAVELGPDKSEALLALARLRGMTGRWQDGIALARRAALDPAVSQDAWALAGLLALESGDLPVLEQATQTLSGSGKETDTLDLLRAGQSLLRGDVETAFSSLGTLLRRDPSNEAARQLFLRAAKAGGRLSEAESLLSDLPGKTRPPSKAVRRTPAR
jgi:tetratricopeptide (TPR) repeat protein